MLCCQTLLDCLSRLVMFSELLNRLHVLAQTVDMAMRASSRVFVLRVNEPRFSLNIRCLLRSALTCEVAWRTLKRYLAREFPFGYLNGGPWEQFILEI